MLLCAVNDTYNFFKISKKTLWIVRKCFFHSRPVNKGFKFSTKKFYPG